MVAVLALAIVIPTAYLAFAAQQRLPTARLWMEKANASIQLIHFGGASVLMAIALALYLFATSRSIQGQDRLQRVCFRVASICAVIALVLLVIMPVA